MEVSKKDWKLYREKIGGWQENYMDRLNKEYVRLLSEEGPASEKFWKLENRIREDRRKPGVLIEVRKQKMVDQILMLLNDKAIDMDDLREFSDELRETISFMVERSVGMWEV